MHGQGLREVRGVREAVRATGLLTGGRPVVVMVSGGQDSVCLLDVAVALCSCERVSALHVNYGLREQADGDERHCAQLCDALGVELERVRPVAGPATPGPSGNLVQSDSSAPSGNLQAWARELRYRAAARSARARGAVIATGHTASDQVETILYRLAASPGRRALLGMLPSDRLELGGAEGQAGAREGAPGVQGARAADTQAGVQLVRPLLAVSREQTAAYCRARGLGWREDESNASPQFARSRVRHGLLPALAAVHPAAEANVLRTARLLRDEAELLDRLVQEQLGGADRIAIERLAALPAALARLVVVRLAEDAAGTYVPQAGPRVQELLALGRRGGRAELHVGGRAGAVIEGGVLRMVKLAPRAGAAGPPRTPGDRAN